MPTKEVSENYVDELPNAAKETYEKGVFIDLHGVVYYRNKLTKSYRKYTKLFYTTDLDRPVIAVAQSTYPIHRPFERSNGSKRQAQGVTIRTARTI